jgi:uncharacterized protein
MLNVALYAALLALLFTHLSLRVILLRRKLRQSLGDGGHPELQCAIAAHANFSQYTPFALLLLLLVASLQVPQLIVHLLGLLLLIGRCLHAWGIISGNFRFRSLGMWLTLGMIGISAAYLLYAVIILAILR